MPSPHLQGMFVSLQKTECNAESVLYSVAGIVVRV